VIYCEFITLKELSHLIYIMALPWFDHNTVKLNLTITKPTSFIQKNTPNNYTNVLTSLQQSNNNYRSNLFHNNNTFNNLISAHKYNIYFNIDQRKILRQYFKECAKIYNLCVDIWKQYKNVTTCWQLLKDIIFKHLYRTNIDNQKNINDITKSIIDELKEKQNNFTIEYKKSEEEYKQLKLEANEKYKVDLTLYKQQIKENKNLAIKKDIKRPNREKIKMNKIKHPKKPRGINVTKPAPDESLKGEIKEFCTNLSNARNAAFKSGDINNFEMKYKNTDITQTIMLSSKNIKKNGIFINALGESECKNFKKVFDKYKVEIEQYDTLNKYMIGQYSKSICDEILNKCKIQYNPKLVYDEILNNHKIKNDSKLTFKCKIEKECESICNEIFNKYKIKQDPKIIYDEILNKHDMDDKSQIKYKIEKDCKLMYDKVLNKYYIFIPFNITQNIPKNRREVVALDPGEKTFLAYFSNEEYGKLGDNMRVRILKIQKKIRKFQSIIAKGKNKKGKKLNNKKHLRRCIRKCFSKIRGYVNEVHKKSAKYLCENYENILLPTFETRPMISKNKIKNENIRITQIPDKVEAKRNINILKKKIKLSKSVKFVLSQQSHYRFKMYLKARAKKYGTIVYDVNEHYTSKTCTLCGHISDIYDGYRMKTCVCGNKIDRDVNGSRNILLKCMGELIKDLPNDI